MKNYTEKNKDYYKCLIKDIMSEGVIYSKDIKKIAAKLEKSGNCSEFLVYHTIVPTLKNILTTNLEIVKEGKKLIYTISGTKEEIISKLDTYFDEKEKKMETVSSSKVKLDSTKRKKGFLNKIGLKNLIEVLRIFVEHNGIVKIKDFRNELVKRKVSKTLNLKIYNNELSKRSISFRIETDRKNYIFSGKSEDALTIISNEYEKLYGEKIDNSRYISRLTPITYDVKSPEVVIDNSKNLWIKWCLLCAGFSIQEDTKKAVGIESICSFVRNWQYEYVTAKRALELFKDMERNYPGSINLTIETRSIYLKNISKLKKELNPKNIKETILVRVGLNLEQVKDCFRKYKEDIRIESRISENDNIYSICIDKSYEVERDLVQFYNKFRGTDQILGNPDLVLRLNTIISMDKNRFESLIIPQKILNFES